jgi:hypothetical protein
MKICISLDLGSYYQFDDVTINDWNIKSYLNGIIIFSLQ